MNSTSTGSSSSSTSTPASSSGGHSGLSGGAIAGIVIGAVAVLLLAAGLFYFAGRTKTLTDHAMGKPNAHNAGAIQGPMSQNPDIGPWSPALPTAQNDHRFSGMTAYSQYGSPHGGATGYSEAPSMGTEHKFTSPPIQQGAFPNLHHSVELPGDAPPVSEAPAGKG
jgi:hypothetical protein